MAEEETNNSYCSSSGEEDGDAAWKAAIDSIAGTTNTYIASFTNGRSATKHSDSNKHDDDTDDRHHKPKTQQIKHYQIKAQKLLNEILEKSIEIVKEPVPVLDEDPKVNECGIRLFKHAQPGIVFDHVDEPQPPKKRPRILPGADANEKSKKFRRRILSVAVDGIDIMAAANDAYKKSIARFEAKDAAAKAAAKREEERVENLKKVRGERWLPSMAKEMQFKYQR
ncbi:uncharacterized protein LOC113859043 [Abrus precatorius]|uniref:Uncharacterized protein LOC113859043 n=1 Tax=Abrus precatorius TaxID=3816 RepID=A0A8B8KUV0_ABRPR|nr:uncharacterized protein LOC113859043 [Abrus precatorius]